MTHTNSLDASVITNYSPISNLPFVKSLDCNYLTSNTNDAVQCDISLETDSGKTSLLDFLLPNNYYYYTD